MATKLNTSTMEGRIGNIIFYQRNGKQCMRIMPTKVKNPRTPAQQLQRAKMVAVTQWLQPLKEVIAKGFVEGSPSYHFNRAVKALFHKAIALNSQGEPYIDPTLAMLASGSLTSLKNAQLTDSPQVKTSPCQNVLRITWEPTPRSIHSHSDDRLVWVLYDIDQRKVISNAMRSPKPNRHKGEATIELPEDLSGTYHLYAFLTNAQGTRASDSTYLGEVEL